MSSRRTEIDLEARTDETAADLGKTIQRLRKAYNLSLGELSEQSGVAKSIISQIERNETNPTLATVVRLSRALDTTVDEVLRGEQQSFFIEHQTKSGIPMLESQDGKCKLAIVGPLSLIDAFQWYDFHAQQGGVLESSPHPPGTVEHLYVVTGKLEVTTGGESQVTLKGEALRYRADVAHKIENIGQEAAHAIMILALKQFGTQA